MNFMLLILPQFRLVDRTEGVALQWHDFQLDFVKICRLIRIVITGGRDAD